MNDIPIVAIASSSSTKPKSIIKLITKENPSENTSGIIIQPWKIDTKYYTAFVNLIGISECFEHNDKFDNQVEAIIIHMDSNKTSGLEDLKAWEALEKQCEPEIKLLVANYCNDETKITREEATNWCLKRGYEFVELYPSDMQNIQNSDEYIIKEKFGVNRIIEALQAHTWSNLVMKKNKNYPTRKTDIRESSLSENDSNILKHNKADNLQDEFLGDDDFTELFSQLHMMKDSLQCLPMPQRKQCAEQMVTAFWKAIGGDEEELSDL